MAAWYDTPEALADRQEAHDGPPMDWDFEPTGLAPVCPACGSTRSVYLGPLGRLAWLQCRACGWLHNVPSHDFQEA